MINTTVYIAYLSDRHVDPEIEVYRSGENAIERAKEFMQENMAHPERIKDLTEELEYYYEIYLGYTECDHAYVVESVLQ